MIFSDFEEHVRTSMNDTISGGDDSAAIWETEEIARYTREAIRAYSQHFPRQRTDTITVVAGTQSYSLPSDILNPPETAIVDARWQRTGYERDHLQHVRMPPGSTEGISLVGTGKGYSIWGDSLYLEDNPSTSDAAYTIALWYYALHEECPVAKGDTLNNFTFTVPDADMDLLFWYVTSLMMNKLESDDAFLRQYADRNDLGIYRDDSPPRKSSEWRMERYDMGVFARMARNKTPKLVRRRR